MASLQGTTVNGDLNTIGNSTSRSTLPAMSAVAFSWNDPVMSYNWTKVANLTGSDAHATLLITTKTDVNYIPYSIFLLSLSTWNSSTLSVKLDCLSSYDVNFTVRIDNSNDVWIQSQAQWSSYLSWRVISSLGTPTLYYSSFVQTITTPANSIAILPGQSVRCNQGAASSATVTNTNDHIFGGITSRGNINGNLVGNVTGTASGNLTSASSLTAGNLTGTIPSTVLGNSTVYIGTTGIALNRASAPQSLGVNIDGSSASCTGNAATATTSAQLTTSDVRTISPSSANAVRLTFGFTSWTNDNNTPYADYLHLRSWSDSSGQNDNLVMFRKDAIGMRIWQAGFGTTQAYSSFKDVAFTDQSFFIGTTSVAINRGSGTLTLNGVNVGGSSASCTGNAANVTGTVLVANGGSGQTSAQAAMNTFAGAVTSGNYLRGNGTNVVMSAIQAADIPTLNQSTSGNAATATTSTRLSDATNGLRIANPGGASYATSSSSVTGAIKIKLPTASFKSNTMMRFTVKIYEYAGGAAGLSRTIEVGGYNYSDNDASWYNIFAYQNTMGGGELNVRFGNDGASQCVWIGELNTNWAYPQVTVTDFQGGYSNYTDAIWSTGWAISFATAFDTITQGPIIAAKPLNSQNYNSYAPTLTGGGANGSWAIDITGNAATAASATSATNVAWTGITSATRNNYNLYFQPPASDFAGLGFNTTGGVAGSAGYLLVRGTSDTDVYTAEGITLVADAGWLTLAQRTTAGKGVRIMTGTTAVERFTVLANGNIGIGTSLPSSRFYVLSNTGEGRNVQLTGATGLGSLFQQNNTVTSLSRPAITLRNTQAGDTISIDRGIGIQFDLGYGGDGTTNVGTRVSSGFITLAQEANADWTTASNRNAYMVFGTISSGTVAERMRISSGGNVTITGTISASNFSGTSTGTNTGDQTNISGNAATVTTNANLTGPVTSVGNATTITNDAITTAKILNNNVTYAKLQQVAGLSVVGNSTNSTATAANITGTANQVLRVNNDGDSLAFGPVNLSDLQAVSGTLPVSRGGTGGTTQATARTTGIGATTVGSNLITLADPGATRFIRINSDNTISALNDTDFRNAIGAGTGGGSGTVTSVSGTGTVSGLTLTGTVTTTGNLTLGGTLSVTASNFASQTANTFLAAPNGAAGTPTFRAIVAADIPTLNQNTIGTAANVTGTVVVGNGGTGATSFTAGRILFGNGTSAINTNANLFWDNTNTRLGVGTTAPAYTLDVGGACHASSFPTSSDVRFKKNIQPLTNALQTILSLRGVKYEWNNFIHSQRSGYELNAPVIGMIAQEVENVIPEIVGKWALNENFQDARSLEYQRIIPYLIEAVKELDNKNKILEARILALENK